MGTLSHGGGKAEGHHTPAAPHDGTCLWCGEVMRYEDPGNGEPGYRGNGAFCSLRCGFQWAVKRVTGYAYRE